MKKKSRIRSIFFYLFLLFAVFGIFLLYLLWTQYRHPETLNPPGGNYRLVPSSLFEKPGIIRYNFELPQPEGIIFSDIARSGSQSLIASGSRSFSPIINIPISEIDSSDSRRISLSAWINIKNFRKKVDASMVFLIDNPLHDVLFSKLIKIKGGDFIRNKWFKVSTSFETVQYKYDKDDRIRIYLRNDSNNDILLDDLEIIFGSQKMMGDSVYTKLLDNATFQAKPNIPPYPPFFFYKEQINNSDAEFLISNAKEKKGNFSENEILLTGNFIHPAGFPQEVLSISDKKLEVFWFLKTEKRFTSISLENHGIAAKMIKPENCLVGDFDGDRYDEVLILQAGKDSCMILNAQQAGKLGLQYIKVPYYIQDLKKQFSYYSFDANGDGKKELLAFDEVGNWKIFELKEQNRIIQHSGHSQIQECSVKNFNYKVIIGRFSENSKSERLLTIYENKADHKTGFMILEFDSRKNQFVRTFKTSAGTGCKVGFDEIKTTDEFFPAHLYPGNKQDLLRRRNDWRFDMKIMMLNDTSYTIIGNVDFAGYDEDHNPKYQESVQILPGNFIDPGSTSLLVIAKHRKGAIEKTVFPNTIQIYSPEWR